jgi:hypothetical protein
VQLGPLDTHRFLITGDPITGEPVEQIVDDVLLPFVAPGASAPGALSTLRA